MVKTMKTSLVDVVTAIAMLKTLVAQSQDGAVVGVDSVSGDDYFQTMPNVGTIYVGIDGLHRIVVDALAYPDHVTDKKRYADENRFISVAFDPSTLVLLPGTRRNVGFAGFKKVKVLSIDAFTWVSAQQARIKAEQDKAAAAAKALDHKRVANARQGALGSFLKF